MGSIEQPSAEHGCDAFHHLYIVLNAGLEGEDVVAVDNDVFVVEMDDGYFFALVGEIDRPLSFGIGDVGAVIRDCFSIRGISSGNENMDGVL